jgi:hypothetical protein
MREPFEPLVQRIFDIQILARLIGFAGIFYRVISAAE